MMVLHPVCLLVLWTTLADGADPVYTPQTISDSVGNSADNSSTITWGSLPAGESYAASTPTRVSAGLTAYYDMMHGFVSAVFIKGFPDEIIEKVVDGDTAYVIENYNEYVPYFIGYAICVAVGVLFFLIFPVVALCFCCCRCCGNCGGNRYQSPDIAKSKYIKYSHTIILAISTALLITSGACIYINNDNMSTAFTTAPVTARENLQDVGRFANNTLEEATHIISNNFDFVKTALFRDLDNIDYLVGIPLREQIKNATNITTTLASAYGLVDAMDYTDGNLSDVETALANFNASLNQLTTSINNFKSTMNTIESNCGVNCPGPFPSYSSAGTDVDTSALPDLSGARNSIDSAKATNLTATVQDAEAELDSIPETVKNDSNSTVTDMKTQINDLSDNLSQVMDQIQDIQGKVSGENATVDLDKLADEIESYSETIEVYDKYRWYGGVGLASMVLLVAVLAAVGVAMGFVGSDLATPPTERGCVSNCGGILLMVSAAFVLIFSSLLMLLTFPTFMLGAPLQEVVCKSLTDMDTLGTLLDTIGQNKILAKEVLQNDTIDLTVVGFLEDCRDGKSVFTALKLSNKFDIDDMLNYSKTLDVNAELDKVTVDFSTVNIYPADLQNQLSDLKTAVNISFSDFYAELDKNASSTNLSALADEIDAYASGVSDSTAQSQLQAQATELRRIESQELVYVEGNVTALNNSVAAMESSVSNIPSQVDTLDSGLQFADSFIKNNGSDVVKTVLRDYADRVLGIIDSFVDYTDTAVKTQLGTCEPVWNVYNSLVIYTLCYNFVDCFNGFWFALGWSVFFFMFSLIFSVRLSKFYRRMLPQPSGKAKVTPEGMESSNGPSKAAYWRKKNKIGIHDDW